MKLRNKKTGKVINAVLYSPLGDCSLRIWEDKVYLDDATRNDGYLGDYETLAELNEEWEDYTPAESLIKDEKIRKAVKAWADYHNITEVECYIGTWDHAGICIPDSVLQLHSIRDRIVIQFFMNADKRENIKEGIYTISELCGEEEE